MTIMLMTLWARPRQRQAGRRAGAVLMAASAISFAAATALAQSDSYTVGNLTVEAPWARATPAGAKVGGAYMKIRNAGAEPDSLMGGSLTGASGVEVHEMSMSNNVMKMRHLPNGLEIKPGQTVELKPGGYHLMLLGLRDGLKQGEKVKGTLTFEKAGAVEVEYAVAPIGAASPGGHPTMKH
jgi:copper(I)-binding protein